MKKVMCLFLLIFLITALFSCSYAEDSIPEQYKPILEAWGATDGSSLKYNVLSTVYSEYEALTPLNIRFGGTTEDLIREKSNGIWQLYHQKKWICKSLLIKAF